MNEFSIISDLEELVSFWPIASFNEVYKKEPALTACSIANITSDPGNPDKTTLIIFRVFIEKGKQAVQGQKYVLGLKFYNFGTLATLDLISLDRPYHKEIAYEHLKRMGWPSIDEQLGRQVDYFNETTLAPFLFVGGHLVVDSGNKIEFSGASMDYGNSVFFSDSNSICKFMTQSSGLLITRTGDAEPGKAFAQRLLDFMLIKKGQNDFYEQFVQEILSSSSELINFTPQQLGSLFMMKVLDRTINEEKNMLQLMVEETVEGFGRYVMVAGVAEKIKRSK